MLWNVGASGLLMSEMGSPTAGAKEAATFLDSMLRATTPAYVGVLGVDGGLSLRERCPPALGYRLSLGGWLSVR